MMVDEERVMENIIKLNLESLNQRLRLFAKFKVRWDVLKIQHSKT